MRATQNAGTATASMRALNTARPPKRSASMPAGMRPNAPSSTGTATRNAVWVALRCSSSRKRGAKALISPQVAKQMANERVASTSCGPDLGEGVRKSVSWPKSLNYHLGISSGGAPLPRTFDFNAGPPGAL